METVFVGLGSNLGDRPALLAGAWSRIGRLPSTRAVRLSSLYESAPVGGPSQGNYLNAAGEISTDLSPLELLDALQGIERELGRVRGERWAPRTIDLDILLWGDRDIHEPGLDVPHPRLAERLFVLMPLCEIAPDLAHPALARPLPALRDALAGAQECGRWQN